jgi:hypothetical protein
VHANKGVVGVIAKDEDEGGDTASISSYETGLETFFDGNQRSLSPFKGLPNGSTSGGGTLTNGILMGSDVSTSTEQGGVVQRRKSVRVSLKPTYAATPPPVVVDEEFDFGVKGKGKGKGGEVVQDIWQDSSEEDEEYAIARKMLARVGESKGKGKGKAR